MKQQRIQLRYWLHDQRRAKCDTYGAPRSMDGAGKRGRGALALATAVLGQNWVVKVQAVDRDTETVIWTKVRLRDGTIVNLHGDDREPRNQERLKLLRHMK